MEDEVFFEVPINDLSEAIADPLPVSPLTMSDPENSGGGAFPVKRPGDPITVSAMENILATHLGKLVTATHFDSAMSRLDENTKKINHLGNEVHELRNEIEDKNTRTNARIDRVESRLTSGPSDPLHGPDMKESAFLRARRSLRVWPIDGTSRNEMEENFKTFATQALDIPKQFVDGIVIESIKRARTSPGGRTHTEIIVLFAYTSDRDFVLRQAKNLAQYVDKDGLPLAGINLEIPQFLMGTFKLLNDHAYHIKRKHGKSTRKYVKFNDDAMSLFLEIRLPGSDQWIRISPELARKLEAERNENEFDSIRKSLRSPTRANRNLIPLGPQRSLPNASTSHPRLPPLPWRPPSRPTNLGPSRDSDGSTTA